MNTLQELFTRLKTHMLTQSVRSFGLLEGKDQAQCLYRGPNGLKCPVGALISDEVYSEQLEGRGVGEPNGIIITALLESGIDIHEFDVNSVTVLELLEYVQDAHDSYPENEWAVTLENIAHGFGLEYN